MPKPSLFIHDDADRTPVRPAGEPPHRIIRGSDFDRPQQPPLVAYLPWPAWVVLGVLSLALGAFLVWRVDQAIRQSIEALRASGPFGVFLIGFTPPAVLAILVYIVLRYVAARVHYSIMRHRYLAYQAGLTRTRLGVPVAVDVAASASWADVMTAEAAAIDMQADIAPHQQYPLLSTKSDSSETGAPVMINGLTDEQAPAGVPASDWLRWIDETPHLMIAGRTNAGKTTLASAILAERIQAGDEVLVIDPHDQPDKWFGVQAVGGGRQYSQILSTLEQVVAEMDERYQAYNSGTPTSAFTRLTVLVDEVPAIMDACLNEKRRMIDARWSNFARQLGSEARKVRISVILLTQSALVQDIGVNTAMRKNFSRIALGDEVRKLLAEEENGERRTTLTELVRGQAHPAVMEHRGEIHVLNTSDVPALVAQDVRRLVSVWSPKVASASAPPVDLQAKLRTNLRALGPTQRAQALRQFALARDPSKRTGWKYTTDELRDLFGMNQNELVAIVGVLRNGRGSPSSQNSAMVATIDPL